jgi:hypothetical protein
MNILEKLNILLAKVEEISLELEDLIDELEELELDEDEDELDEDELDEDELDEDEENILVVLSSKE